MSPDADQGGPQTDAWQELARACAPRQRIDRFHARAVLLAIGRTALEGDLAGAGALVARAKELTAARQTDWEAAVGEEILLASTEHIRSVDPRFLARPDYDLAYTVDARADLEARLRAAEVLGVDLAPGLLDRIAAADRLLAPLLDARRSTGPGDG